MTSDIIVKIDDRVRLMSALLAATRYPELSQQKKPHGTHAHARATKKFLGLQAGHEAATTLQTMIDQRAPLEAIFALALVLRPPQYTVDKPPRWMPPGWNDKVRDFETVSGLAGWWQSEAAVWSSALDQSQKMFAKINLKPFLKPFVGEIKERLIFMPNILYPTDQELSFRLGNDLVAIIPPRLAWGDSPPWPFDEDPAHVYRAAILAYGRLLMSAYLRTHQAKVAEIAQTPLPISDALKAAHPGWTEQFTALFVAGAVAIYLEDHVSHAEAKSYILMEKKVNGLDVLPGVVSVLRRYLTEREAGRYQNLLEFLPVFPRQLRVARRIVTL